MAKAPRGLKRVEVQVRPEDASLIKEFAAGLNDPERAATFRAALAALFRDTLQNSILETSTGNLDGKNAAKGPPLSSFDEQDLDALKFLQENGTWKILKRGLEPANRVRAATLRADLPHLTRTGQRAPAHHSSTRGLQDGHQAMRTLADFDDNGRNVLNDLIKNSDWKSLEQALASLTVFSHPDVVNAVKHKAIFQTIRRTPTGEIKDGVMLDDNYSPQIAFRHATGFKPKSDMQCCHVYNAAKDPDAYTNIANIFYAPSFLAKLTDSQAKHPPPGHITWLFKYRVWELYGYCDPKDATQPDKPDGYDALEWAEPVGAGATAQSVEKRLRDYLNSHPKDRLTKSVARLGWYFSGYKPDPHVKYTGN